MSLKRNCEEIINEILINENIKIVDINQYLCSIQILFLDNNISSCEYENLMIELEEDFNNCIIYKY